MKLVISKKSDIEFKDWDIKYIIVVEIKYSKVLSCIIF